MMPDFFSALNPVSKTSGVTFRATGKLYSEAILQQDLPDLTLDLVIPFLWSRNLSVLDGIYETFTVFYGDHFDRHSHGFGQKGVLDFTLLPLLSRKLIADTYLEDRKDHYLFNSLAWIVALPIRAISFGVALACTIAMIPIIVIVTLLRWLSSTPPPPSDSSANAMALSIPTAYAALHVGLHRLELAGIRTTSNIQRLLADPQNLALVYAMERLIRADGNAARNQEMFDFLLEHRDFWIDTRMIENLDGMRAVNQPVLDVGALLQALTGRGVINDSQSTHTASVHSSTAKSAVRLKEVYCNKNDTKFNVTHKIAKIVKQYDEKLVGERTDQDILNSLNSTISRLTRSGHIDPASKIASRALLQYCWSAAHDKTQWREGVTQETAEACFYAALYEVDREYALSASGVDTGCSGRQEACEGGAFNKLIECMAKIHQLCEVNFISPATAALYLPCVVRQVLKKELSKHPNELKIELEQLKHEGITDLLWSHLDSEVADVMEANFSDIYPKINGQINPNLKALVAAGQDTDLTQVIPQLEQQLLEQKSSGEPMSHRMMCNG